MAFPAEPIRLPASEWRIEPRKALAFGLLCWIAFGLIAWMVHGGHTAAIDRAGLLMWRRGDLQPRGPGWLREGVRDLTALGGVLLRNLFAFAALTALLFVHRRREAAMLAFTLVSGWLIDDAVKHILDRPRPGIVPHLTEAGGASFPSGHSFNAALIYLAVALAFAAISPRRGVRLTIIAAAVIASLTIAWSRVWLGVHWPSDALAGWLGGTGWAMLAAGLRSLRSELPAAGNAPAGRRT
jgi:undecaprenyl-diphosphatase